jgi:transposase
MRTAAAVELNPEQRRTMERMARARSLPARVVERARVVLLAADGLENKQIAQRMKMTPEKAARWRNRFLEGGTAALEKDAPRPGRTRTITDRRVKRVVDMTLHQKPANATHWSTRTMARAAGISEASVRRIWQSIRNFGHHFPELRFWPAKGTSPVTRLTGRYAPVTSAHVGATSSWSKPAGAADN